MTLTFPDERLLYTVDAAGRLAAVPVGTVVDVWRDDLLSLPADLEAHPTAPGQVLAGHQLVVQEYSRWPRFLSHTSEDTLWVSVLGGPASPLYQVADERLDAYQATLASFTADLGELAGSAQDIAEVRDALQALDQPSLPSMMQADLVIPLGSVGWTRAPDMAIGFEQVGLYEFFVDLHATGPNVSTAVKGRFFDAAAPPTWCSMRFTASGPNTTQGGGAGNPSTQYSDSLTETGVFKWGTTNVVTSVAAGSNGVALPAAVISLASTANLAGSGTVKVTTDAGVQTVAYTGVAGSTLTGCTGGTGTMSTGGTVWQENPSTCRIHGFINVTEAGHELRPSFGQNQNIGANLVPVVLLGQPGAAGRPGCSMVAHPRGTQAIPLNGNQWTSQSGVVYQVGTPAKPYSLSLPPALPAPSKVRVELHEGDQRPADVAEDRSTERCELGSTRYYKLGDVLWIYEAIRFTGTLDTRVLSTGHTPYVILNQLIQTPPDVDPATGLAEVKYPTVWAIYLRDGQLQLHTRGDAAEISTAKVDAVVRYAETWADEGQWMDWVFRITLHHTTGTLKAWKNGVLKVDVSNIPTFHNGPALGTPGSNDLRGARHKFGIYRGSTPNVHVAEFGNGQTGVEAEGADFTSYIAAPPAHPA